MCNDSECANYLRGNDAYKRCMLALRKKWESLGRASGNIALKNATEQERRAIGGIVGRAFTGDVVKFTFSEFEQGLQKTKFAPVDMKAVLEDYFGCTLSSSQERKLQAQTEKEGFLSGLASYALECAGEVSVSSRWICAMKEQKKYGYQILMREFAADREKAKSLGRNVCEALSSLERQEGGESLLAVFAASISGNPHYFDRGTVPSQLLTSAICFWKGTGQPKDAMEWRKLLQEAGLACDNIASMVHVLGARAYTEEGPHPACEAFCARREPYVLTAENLRLVTHAEAEGGKAYVVENEMVFLYLAEHLKERKVTLLCTSGQLRAAAFMLLDRLVAGGASIFYSGDLDPEGMDIADRLWLRYGEAVRLWRMDAADYRRSISKERISEERIGKCDSLRHPQLRRVAEELRRERCAGYQENLLEELLADCTA